MHSFNETLDHYRALLLAQQEHRLQLPNDNLDTGAVTGAAAYRLTDETYAKLLNKTSGKPISEALRRDLLSYYVDLEKPFATKRNSKAWHDLIKELDILKSTPVGGNSAALIPVIKQGTFEPWKSGEDEKAEIVVQICWAGFLRH